MRRQSKVARRSPTRPPQPCNFGRIGGGRLTRDGSPAGDAHMPRDRRPAMAAIDDEIMALWLTANGLIDGRVQQVVTFGGAQRGAQIGGVFLTKAHEQGTSASDADAIAGLAEIVRQRGDEAQSTTGFLNPDITRGPTGTIIDVLKHEILSELFPYQRQRQVLIEPTRADV